MLLYTPRTCLPARQANKRCNPVTVLLESDEGIILICFEDIANSIKGDDSYALHPRKILCGKTGRF
jgi:hypothetical protein